MPGTVFTARALTKVYTSGEVELQALRGLSLEILAGEVIVLLGPSGSGKSTLLNIMGGLDDATSGSLFFRDLDLTRLDDRGLTLYRRQHVGFVFQFYNLIPSNSQLGTTTLIITHNASIQDVADRVLFFADGQISGIRVNEARRAASELSW